MMMKRRLTAALAAVVCLGAGIAVAVGSVSDEAMIAQSYYEDTYLPALTETLRQRAEKGTQSTYERAEKDLEERNQARLDQIQALAGEKTAFTSVQLAEGDELSLEQGSAILLERGAGRLTAGTLADVTEGVMVEAGQALAPAHRYVAVAESGATVCQTAPGSAGFQGGAEVEKGAGLALPFTDVPEGQWYHDAVAFVYRRGYFAGTGADTFSPNAPMDRAMVATVLHRISGGESVAEPAAFSDVPAGQWYSDGIAWAAAKGVVNGMGEGLYAPAASVTREQLVTMLYRYQKDYLRAAVTAGGDLAAFSDGDRVSDWAREAVAWAVGEGLVQGRDSGALDPAGTATRAEVAAILQRFSQGLSAGA